MPRIDQRELRCRRAHPQHAATHLHGSSTSAPHPARRIHASAAQQQEAQQSSASADVAQLKQRLRDLTKGKESAKSDDDDGTKKQILQLFDEFSGLGDPNPEQQDIDGSDWEIVFSDSRRSVPHPASRVSILVLFFGVLRCLHCMLRRCTWESVTSDSRHSARL